MMHSLMYISQQDIAASGALSMDAVIRDLEEVFRLHQQGDYIMPSKAILRWGDVESEKTRGRINAMPGYLGGNDPVAGLKWVGSAPENPFQRQLPRASAILILNDPVTMLPLAVMDGTLISAMRTGAVTGLAAKYLARPEARTVGLVGAGAQNKTQLLALLTALDQLSLVRVYDLSAERAEQFALEAGAELGIDIRSAASLQEALHGADIVVTATTASKPFVRADDLAPGTFYSHIGGYEADFSVIEHAGKIVVDDWSKIRDRGSQTLSLMYQAGFFDPASIHAELGELVAGLKPGRETEEETIYFNSVGMSISDLKVGKRVLDRCRELGLGQRLEWLL